MTANLIAYWNYAEGKRHNAVTEEETVRHNKAVEDYNRDSLLEVIRHNTATEAETYRSNLAREVENMRHNMAYENETQRHNMAYEAETHRHNVTTETETERSNRANEAIKRESNQIGWANIGLGYAQLAEAARHNQAYEAIQRDTLLETSRHNIVNERYQYANLGEIRLHNRRAEANAWRNTDLGYLQSDRTYALGLGDLFLDFQRVEETKRHNERSEELQQYSNATARANAWTGGIRNVVDAAKGVVSTAGIILPWIV